MPGAAAHPFAVAASAQVVSGAVLLVGWSFRETTGAAGAAVDIRDGSVNGELVASIGLPAGLSETVWAGDRGIGLYGGLFVSLVSGAVRGAVWAIPVERVPAGGEVSEPAWWDLADGVPL